jgi:hypothetical protein
MGHQLPATWADPNTGRASLGLTFGLSMNESKMELAGNGDQAYIFHEALNASSFLGWI